MEPLVSVVTPTWRRHETLGDSLRSVQAQAHQRWEHLIVSDGPDPALRARLADRWPGVRYLEMPSHDDRSRWGVKARQLGWVEAKGEFVAYLDDDDTWRPNHLRNVLGAMAAVKAAVGWGSAMVHFPDQTMAILGGEPKYGRVQTSMIVHRRDLLDVETWREGDLPDCDLLAAWLAKGVRYAWAPEVSVDYWRARPAPRPNAALTVEDYLAWRAATP